jgi:flagellar biosynthetic protein FliQ
MASRGRDTGNVPARHVADRLTGGLATTLTEGWWAVDLSLSLQEATDLIRQTLVIALVVSAPMLLIGLAVGIVVSLLQAVTQIQEQTLTFIPKIVAMVAAAILLMPWMGQRLLDYSAAIFLEGRIP